MAPYESPANEHSTIGGIVAANATGASTLQYGGIRNWLLGVRILTANGDTVHAGSKVVKSVAGYDMHKLFIGSFGTLAAIEELTFKVAPIPEFRTLLTCSAMTTHDLPDRVRALRQIQPLSSSIAIVPPHIVLRIWKTHV